MDYLYKLIRSAAEGYRFQVHVNGQSGTGYALALAAALVGRLWNRPIALSWRGGLKQKYFPRPADRGVGAAFRLLFRLAGQIVCNDMATKRAIESYGIEADRVAAIPGFSRQHVEFRLTPLAREVESFLDRHQPVFFCYVSFRPEYTLPVLREAMQRFQRHHPQAGFIWLGFPSKEMPGAQRFAAGWSQEERDGLLLLGNLPHDDFLTLLTRCSACIRTPVCDGVAASILESLALGIPVIASQNHNRPSNVITYAEDDAADLCEKLSFVTAHSEQVKAQARLQSIDDNIERTADWLLGGAFPKAREISTEVAHAR
jgi:glycosyltransferase involved in cell wall biosynthesis